MQESSLIVIGRRYYAERRPSLPGHEHHVTLMSELEANKEKQSEADESLKATVFTLLDIDSSGAVSIMEIGQRLGQDLRDRAALQELFPDLMSGKPSDLFLIAGGESGHPERVNVSRENWDVYWEMIEETLRRTKLHQLHQRIIDQSPTAK